MKIRKLIVTLLIVFSIIPALLTSTLCIVNFTTNFRDMTRQALQNAASTQADAIEVYWKQQESNIRAISRLSSTRDYLADSNSGTSSPETALNLSFLNTVLQTRAEEDPMIEEASLLDQSGRIIASSSPSRIGSSGELSDMEKSALLGGQYGISGLHYSKTIEPNEKYFNISYPILSKGKYAGCLMFSSNVRRFSQIVSENHFLSSGALAILDRDGNIVETSNENLNKNAYEIAQKNTLSEQLRQVNLQQNPTGLLLYTMGADKKAACYSAIGESGWCVLSTAMRSEYSPSAPQIIGLITGTLLIIALLAVLAFVLITRYFSTPFKQLLSTIRRIQSGNYNRRFMTSRHDELAEIGISLNQLMDKIVADNQELALKEERYRIVSEQSDSAIFEYHINDKTMFHTANFIKKFGYEPPNENMPAALFETNMVSPDDEPLLMEFFEHIIAGQEDVRTEIRLLQMGTGYIWCAVHATTIFDEKHHPVRAVGSVSDIDKKKKETAQLLARAQRDPLTALYNKSTTELLIQECLEYSSKQSIHALFVIDVDNFKLFNDTFGHLFGDKVLKDIAKKITATFRSTDIIGRIGGDEFVLFIKDLTDISHVYEKAATLIAIFDQAYTSPGASYSVSSSIGISLYPRDGETFVALFKNADQALYAAKRQGKNQYSVFNQGQTDGIPEQVKKRVQAAPASRSHENLAEYVFRTLYDTDEFDVAVVQILEMIGKYFRVSRAYIYETAGDWPVLTRTFEWCAHTASCEEQPGDKELPILLGSLSYPDLFGEDRIFYCEDLSILPQPLQDFMRTRHCCSVLQCELLENNIFCGFIGFDECEKKRVWTKQEINTLSLISNLLSVFLSKSRAGSRLKASERIPQEILDAQNLWNYVIDQDTYQLLFVNKKTNDLLPGIRLGQTCYRVFFKGQDAPCAMCPMAGLNESNPTCTKEIFNPHLKIWTSATASYMKWGGRNRACLVCCTNITRYKCGEIPAPSDEPS